MEFHNLLLVAILLSVCANRLTAEDGWDSDQQTVDMAEDQMEEMSAEMEEVSTAESDLTLFSDKASTKISSSTGFSTDLSSTVDLTSTISVSKQELSSLSSQRSAAAGVGQSLANTLFATTSLMSEVLLTESPQLTDVDMEMTTYTFIPGPSISMAVSVPKPSPVVTVEATTATVTTPMSATPMSATPMSATPTPPVIDQCAMLEYFNGTSCVPCSDIGCNSRGTVQCDQTTCTCHENVTGSNCDRCSPNFFGNLSACEACQCNIDGTVDGGVCDSTTGQCPCQPLFAGLQCGICQDGYHIPPNQTYYESQCLRQCLYSEASRCQPCLCHPRGSKIASCNALGHCTCRDGHLGPKCDRCPDSMVFTETLGCIRPADFYRFGESAGDTLVHNTAGEHRQDIVLPVPVVPIALGTESAVRYETLRISTGGYVSFADPIRYFPTSLNESQQPVLAPFWSSTDFRFSGRMFYQMHNDTETLELATSHVKNVNTSSLSTGFQAQVVLVVTWVEMRAFPAGREALLQGLSDLGRNSFQLVLTWDGCVTFAFFHYANGSISWTGRDGINAVVGAHDGQRHVSTFDSESVVNSTRRRLFVILTTNCEGVLAADRDCRRDTRSLSTLEPAIRACPLTAAHAELSPLRRLASPNVSQCFAAPFRSATQTYPVCCYSLLDGAFLSGGTTGSFVTSPYHPIFRHSLFVATDLHIRARCCEASTCQRFYNKRPMILLDLQTLLARPVFIASLLPEISLMHGDPHLTTLDGISYTFNGFGEYILSDSPHAASNTSLVIQGRTTPVPGSNATVLVAVAIGYFSGLSDENRTLMTKIQATLSENGELEVLSDGTDNVTKNVRSLENNPSAVFQTNGNASIAMDNGNTAISFANGGSVRLSVVRGRNTTLLSASYVLSQSFYSNDSRGLLGVYNGNSADDFRARNGTLYASTSTEEDLFLFGQSWQIKTNAEETLFTYENNSGPQDFAHPSHVPNFLSDTLKNSTISEEIKDQCGSNRQCLFDALETNDVSIGASTLQQEQTLKRDRKIAQNIPPVINGDNMIATELNKTTVYLFNVSDPGDTFNISVSNPAVTLKTTTNALHNEVHLRLTRSTDMVTFQIVANDSVGAFSILRPIITYCGCENNEPCLPVPADEDGGSNRFISLPCNCSQAYTGRYCQMDKNGCQLGAGCYPGVQCEDVKAPGVGFSCSACPTGYSGDGTTCDDVNECAERSHDCDGNATCTNTAGSFQCTCNSGYRSDAGNRCVAIQLCNGTNTCFSNGSVVAKCENKTGKLICFCPNGFYGDGREQCIDENECTERSHDCGGNATCTNTAGSFQCTCSNGYQNVSNGCVDENECTERSHDCGKNATCTNTAGSFQCSCNSGYQSDNSSRCVDKNECIERSHDCGGNATCTNTAGSFHCTCPSGYQSDNNRRCVDVNECAKRSHDCGGNATCTNTAGSFQCICHSGFQSDVGNHCVEIQTTKSDDGVAGWVIAVAVIASLLAVFIAAVIVIMLIRQRQHSNVYFIGEKSKQPDSSAGVFSYSSASPVPLSILNPSFQQGEKKDMAEKDSDDLDMLINYPTETNETFNDTFKAKLVEDTRSDGSTEKETFKERGVDVD